jgi:hypothetical protein
MGGLAISNICSFFRDIDEPKANVSLLGLRLRIRLKEMKLAQ